MGVGGSRGANNQPPSANLSQSNIGFTSQQQVLSTNPNVKPFVNGSAKNQTSNRTSLGAKKAIKTIPVRSPNSMGRGHPSQKLGL